jgi:hypothetical protein
MQNDNSHREAILDLLERNGQVLIAHIDKPLFFWTGSVGHFKTINGLPAWARNLPVINHQMWAVAPSCCSRDEHRCSRKEAVSFECHDFLLSVLI